jgi:hypothetical protein
LTCSMTHTPSIILLLKILLWTVIVPFRRQVIFKQYTPKKYIHFGIKLYKLCDMSGYTYDMGIYSGEDMTCVTTNMTATHMIVKQLTECGMTWTACHRLIYSMIWQSGKTIVVGESDLTEKECNRTCYHDANDWNKVTLILR